MGFVNRILIQPSYGFVRNGELYVPSRRELFREFFHRLNIFNTRKNWVALLCWIISLLPAIPLYFFVTRYFSLPLVALGFVYSMVILGTFGTIYYHRFATHRAYRFRNRFALFIVRNLVIKLIPEELYVVSHHVHHTIPEKPGDPYNVHAGWLYCFLADAIHQPIARNLSESDYWKVAKLVRHTGIHVNNYRQYLTWGSVCHPGWTIINIFLNWSFWYTAFWWLGGHALATALFASAGFWAIGVRTFNFEGHGKGKDRRRDGIDFNRKDWSVNQVWPGYLAGEWHNNHHLYPNSARAGFLPYQLDLAWLFIRFYNSIGGISWYRDDKAHFMKNYYLPYLARKRQMKLPPSLSGTS
jgi:stearoyl-CoA desaturase (delta-9 desaturase)